MITKQERDAIVEREQALTKWLHENKRNYYQPAELPPWINPPTNDERSAVEVFDFITNPPEKYFLYIDLNGGSFQKCKYPAPQHNGPNGFATTWTGERLGSVSFGHAYYSNFGDVRVPVTVKAINGRRYVGTYFYSAGDYAHIRLAKHQ